MFQTSPIPFACVRLANNGVLSESYSSHSLNNDRSSCIGSPDTVGCDRCKKFFHMSCVQPPLLAKPSRGYGWTCAPCSKRHEEEVDSHEVRHPTPVVKPKSNAPAPRGRGRPRKDRSLAEKEENLEIKYFKMWPFRYFGCVFGEPPMLSLVTPGLMLLLALS